MNRQALLVAFLFAAAAAGLVLAAFEGERRYETHVAENPAPPTVETDVSDQTWAWSDLWNRDRPLIDGYRYGHMLLIVTLCAYFWLLMLAFEEHLAWGIAILFGSAIAILIFVAVHPKKTIKTAVVMYGSFAASVWTLYHPT